MKKKILLIILFLFMITGCTTLNDKSIDQLLPILLSSDNELSNVVFDGYKYYVPNGIRFVSKDDYNAQLLDDKNNNYYFYIDVVSYYNEVEGSYEENEDAYYSKALDYNGKKGYLEITEIGSDGYYFVEFMYNYGKIEAYLQEKDINNALIYMSNILTSLQFNRNVLESIIGDNVLNYREETYNVMEPVGGSTNQSYLDYVEQYDNYEGYTPREEEEIEIDETK